MWPPWPRFWGRSGCEVVALPDLEPLEVSLDPAQEHALTNEVRPENPSEITCHRFRGAAEGDEEAADLVLGGRAGVPGEVVLVHAEDEHVLGRQAFESTRLVKRMSGSSSAAASPVSFT